MNDHVIPASRTSVLLIEDNAGDARLIRELLSEAGTGVFHMERADCLSAGLAAIDQGDPGLILLDLSLPDSEGLATVVAVRRHAPHLPLIVLTGNDDDSLALAAVGAGAQDYLVKGRINSDSLDRAIRYAIERKRVADALKETSTFNTLLLQTSPLGVDIVDEDGVVLFVSPGLEAIVGESPVGKRCWEVYKDDRQQCGDCPLKSGIDIGETKGIESLGVLGERDFEIIHTGMVYRGRKAVLEVFHDITERKRAERRDQLAQQVLSLLNRPEGETDTIHELLRLIKASTGVDAVGIRLREGDDFPYYQTNGYPEEFLRTERSLCARNEAGEIARDCTGQAVLECLCGAVISGQTDAVHPSFTERGSYWTNSTTDFRTSIVQMGLDSTTTVRNRCNDAGYESLALIPLRSGPEIIGLLQLSHHRRDRFSPQAVRFFEGLGASIGIALARKQAEEALRKSESLLRTIFEGTQALLVSVDANGHFTYANEAMAKAVGYASPEELIGKAYLHFVHPEDRQRVLDTFTNQASARRPSSLQEFRITGAEGTPKWVSFLSTLAVKDGQVVGQSGVALDITTRKQAEEAQQRAEQRYRALFEDAPAMYVITRDAGGEPVIVESNELFCQTLGFSHDELIGRPLADFYSPASRVQMLEGGGYRRALAGESVAEERELVTRDGRIVSSVMRAVPEVDAAGRVSGARAMYVDITERNRTEAERQCLLEIMRGAATTESLQELLALIRHSLAKVIYAENFFVVFHNKNTGLFEEVFAVDKYDAPMPPSRLERSITSYVFRTGEPLLLTAAGFDGLMARGEVELVGTRQAVWLGAPLKTPSETIGVMVVQNYEDPNCYSERDREFFASVSAQVALVIERKRAEVEILRRGAQQTALNAILAAGIAAGAELDSLLNVAIDHTLKALGLEMGAIWIAPSGGRAHSFVVRGLPAEFPATMGLLARTGQVQTLESTMSEDAWLPKSAFADSMRASGLSAALTTPLLHNGKVIGGVSVASPSPRAWSSDEVALVEAVGSQLGIVIERARLYEETQQRMNELEAVSRVSSALREASSLQQILDTLLDQTLAILGTDAGDILLHNPASNRLRPGTLRGWFARLPDQSLGPNEGIAGATFSGGQVIVSREFRSDPQTRAIARGWLPEGWGGACVPLRTAEEVVGVLFVSVQLPREIGKQELRLLNTLAEIGGNAIHRTRLHEQTERQLTEAEALRDVERAVASTFDLGLTLGLVARHAAQLLGADASAVLVLSAHSHDLEYAAWSGFRSRVPARARLGLAGSCAGRVAMERCVVSLDDLPNQADQGWLPPFYAAEGFVSYRAAPIIAKGALKGVLEVLHRGRLDADPHWQDLLTTLAGQAAIAIDNNSLFDGLQRSNDELTVAYEATIEGWSRALDLRDNETEGHSQRVTDMALRLASLLKVPEADLVHVRRGALLHDIGKLGVPDQILLKPGRLTEEEWMLMRGHPQLAYDLLAPITYLNPALDIPYCHHEKWDGTGYPRRLKGEQIPFAARVFAVVDVWDALGSDRPYRKAWPREKTVAYMRERSGADFDPRILDAFLTMMEQ